MIPYDCSGWNLALPAVFRPTGGIGPVGFALAIGVGTFIIQGMTRV
jgi:hypothetical protein